MGARDMPLETPPLYEERQVKRYVKESPFRKEHAGVEWMLAKELENRSRAFVAYLKEEERASYKPIDC